MIRNNVELKNKMFYLCSGYKNKANGKSAIERFAFLKYVMEALFSNG